MEKQCFVFLVRRQYSVEVTHEKPKGVEISQDGELWVFERHPKMDPFVNHIGSSGEFRYCGGWEGPIGVYDLSKPKHVKELIKQFRFHHNEILSSQLRCETKKAFGRDAESAEGYLLKTPIEQRRGLTTSQRRYLSIRQMLCDITGTFEKKESQPLVSK